MLHDAIEHIEDGHSDEGAIELAWGKWGSRLWVDDLTLLKEDIGRFHDRDFGNVRTILAEGEIKVPLTEMPDGTPVYFRGRIDRLYERLHQPGQFIHVDYKSSRWPKDQEEVDKDPQMWAYNWLVHEFFPECLHLDQLYEQFRGDPIPTRKSDEQREEIRKWLAIEARAYFAEHELLEDGLPAPKFNQWCPWCPILEDCQIIPQLSDWARTRIELLSDMGPELTPIGEYIERYDEAQTAIKTLERYVESIKTLVREADEPTRGALGFQLRGRSSSVIPVRARTALYEALGHDRFMEMAGITQERLKSIEDPEQREWALSLVEKVPGPKVVYRRS